MILRIADIPVCISIDPALGELPLPASYSAFIEADSFYEANEADGFYETNEATGSAGATEKSELFASSASFASKFPCLVPLFSH